MTATLSTADQDMTATLSTADQDMTATLSTADQDLTATLSTADQDMTATLSTAEMDLTATPTLGGSFNISSRTLEPNTEVLDDSLPDRQLTDSILEEEEVTFDVVEAGTKRGGKKLVSSAGFSYTLKRPGHWICSVRNKKMRCPAKVTQRDDCFIALSEHAHPADPGVVKRTKITAQIKAAAGADIFRPAMAIVEDTWEDTVTDQDFRLPKPVTLKRIANRFRQSKRPSEPSPTDIMFEVEDPVYACDESDFSSTNRKRVTVEGRDVFIIKVRGQYHALDSFCYHAGGPLHEGQIEDIGQWTCVRCPWHNYKICVANGEGIYESIDPFNMDKPPEMKSKGVKQRTHTVSVHGGKVYIQLSDVGTAVESDHYNCKEYREKYALR